MPPKSFRERQHAKSLARINAIAANPGQLFEPGTNPELRFAGGYCIAISSFLDDIEPYRGLFKGRTYFAPLSEYIDAIDNVLAETISWLCDFLDGRIAIDTLEQNLRDESASWLESTLDQQVTLYPTKYRSVPKWVDGILEDVEGLGNDLRDRIRKRGYALHDVFIMPPRATDAPLG